MSAIPPDIAGAAAQAGFAASESSRTRDADRTGQARIADRQVQATSDRADSVEAGDADTAVFADAEGAGGQGRNFSDQHPEEDANVADGTADDAEASNGGLDIQA